MHVEENPYRPTTVGTAKRPGRWAYFLAYGCFGSVLLSVGSCVACPFVIRSYVQRQLLFPLNDN